MLYEQTELPGKGIGIVATAPITAWTLILAERPLLIVPRAVVTGSPTPALNACVAAEVSKLTKPKQDAFRSLHDAKIDPPSVSSPLLSIIKTNGFGLGGSAVSTGVFEVISRFNHSCSPNATFLWNESVGHTEVRACVDISVGDEITINYLSSDMFNQPHPVRQADLKRRYGFVCKCSICGADKSVRDLDNRRRAEAQRLYNTIGDHITIIINPARALKYCRELIRLRELLGHHFDVASICYDAFQVCIAHGDLARAKAFMLMHNRLREERDGVWAVDAEMRTWAETPEAHVVHQAISNNWRTAKKKMKAAGSVGFDEWLWMRAEK
jgi:hypothetical protein